MVLPVSITRLMADLPNEHPALAARTAASNFGANNADIMSMLREKASAMRDAQSNLEKIQRAADITSSVREVLLHCVMSGVLGDKDRDDVSGTLVQIENFFHILKQFQHNMHEGQYNKHEINERTGKVMEAAKQFVGLGISALQTVTILADMTAEEEADAAMRLMAKGRAGDKIAQDSKKSGIIAK